MPPAKKAKRKSKPPARLKEFFCEEYIEKELEPRRSRRTPKISEKLKRYMDDKGGLVKEQDGVQVSNQMKKEPRITVSPGHDLLGSEYMDPRVVLKALPKSMLQKGTRKYPLYKREVSVTLKRLGKTGANKKSSRIYTSKLHKQKAGVTKAVSATSYSSQDNYSSSTGRQLQNRRGKRKRVSAGHKMQPKEKCSRVSPRMSELKAKDEKIKEKGDSQFDPDVMNKLFNFGAKVEEVLILNKEAINKLSKDKGRAESFTQMVSDGLKDFDEDDYDQILNWLEEEELQRKEHREKVLESLRVSHSTNIALYSHMLTVLQSVTASL